MDEFLTARERNLKSVSDIIGSDNFTQMIVQSKMIVKAFLIALENSEHMILSSQIFPKESVQFVIRISLFVCILIFCECRLVNAYCLLEILSVARIVWLFPMNQKDVIDLTLA